MMFDSIYHSHIPRTGGTFVKTHLKNEFANKGYLSNHNTELNKDIISNSYYVAGHWGNYPIQYMKNPLVFTILRNPVDRFLSTIKYTKFMFPEISSEELLDYWLYDPSMSELNSNTQFKFLTGTIDVDSYNDVVKNSPFFIQGKMLQKKPMIENNWFINNNEKTKEDAFKFIDSHHIFFIEDIDGIISGLPKLLNVNPFLFKNPINQSSPTDFKISNSQYERIIELNSIDLEIYDYAIDKHGFVE